MHLIRGGKTARSSKNQPQEFPTDPVESARVAGLQYMPDTGGPGIARRKVGSGFSYVGLDGKPVRDKATLQRIHALVIPPAWAEVWISPSDKTHLQAVGRDARGRKQYRYHALYRDIRNQTKFGKVTAFAQALPGIRRHVETDVALTGLSKRKVLAAIVRLLETTCIRVGNDEYARDNVSFGLTTLRDRHVDVAGPAITFHFRGKSGQYHECSLKDRTLARIVKQCQDVPGFELFQYRDEEGEARRVTSGDVNEYLREVAGEGFTAKDFRTWAGTVHTAVALRDAGPADSETAAKRAVVAAIKHAAGRLGNKPATCRNYYVHPAVLEAYVDGSLFEVMNRPREVGAGDGHGLTAEERAVVELVGSRAGQAGTVLQRFFGPRKKAS